MQIILRQLVCRTTFMKWVVLCFRYHAIYLWIHKNTHTKLMRFHVVPCVVSTTDSLNLGHYYAIDKTLVWCVIGLRSIAVKKYCFLFNQCSTTGVIRAAICTIIFVAACFLYYYICRLSSDFIRGNYLSLSLNNIPNLPFLLTFQPKGSACT